MSYVQLCRLEGSSATVTIAEARPLEVLVLVGLMSKYVNACGCRCD